MQPESFYKLNRLLFNHEIKKKYCTPPHGYITNSIRLSMALRWMAGSDKFDIGLSHGCSPKEVLKSVWNVVDAVNNCDSLKFKFPETYEN